MTGTDVLGVGIDGPALISAAAEDPVARAARELLEEQARASFLVAHAFGVSRDASSRVQCPGRM